VVHEDVGGAGRTRASIGAYDAIGGEGDFDLRRFEPFVEKVGGALGEDLHQAHGLAAAEFVEACGDLQIFEEVAGTRAG